MLCALWPDVRTYALDAAGAETCLALAPLGERAKRRVAFRQWRL